MSYLSNSSFAIEEINDIVLKKLAKICKPIIEPDKIKPFDTFQSLNIDSLAFIEMIIEFENHFNIQFDEDFLLQEAYVNVESLTNYIFSLFNKKQ